MYELPIETLGQACRLFLERAYPAGPQSIPPKKRVYFDLDPARPLADYLPPAPAAAGIVEPLSTRKDGPRGHAFRLGSARYPHVKLRVQRTEHHGDFLWVFTVDTHDFFSRSSAHPPADHPEYQGWRDLQQANRRLKEEVEEALEQAGLLTFKSLLRLDLQAPAAR